MRPTIMIPCKYIADLIPKLTYKHDNNHIDEINKRSIKPGRRKIGENKAHYQNNINNTCDLFKETLFNVETKLAENYEQLINTKECRLIHNEVNKLIKNTLSKDANQCDVIQTRNDELAAIYMIQNKKKHKHQIDCTSFKQ